MADSVVAAESYTLSASAPTFSPVQGTYTTSQNVTLSSASQGVTIRYTTDGTTPTEASTAYSSPVAVTQTTTLKAKAFRSGWTESGVSASTYTMKVATASLSPSGGSYTSSQSVTVTGTTPGASLHYTLDGTEPTESSPTVSSGSSVLVSQSSTLMVKGFNGPGWTPSDLKVATYVISQGTVSAPTATPGAGTYPSPQLVTLSTSTAGASIRYTLDGTEPSRALVLPTSSTSPNPLTTTRGSSFPGSKPSTRSNSWQGLSLRSRSRSDICSSIMDTTPTSFVDVDGELPRLPGRAFLL